MSRAKVDANQIISPWICPSLPDSSCTRRGNSEVSGETRLDIHPRKMLIMAVWATRAGGNGKRGYRSVLGDDRRRLTAPSGDHRAVIPLPVLSMCSGALRV